MAHQLSFERLIAYDPGEAGITVDIALSLFEQRVAFTAKVDTGASYCIFERRHGESLGLDIENGLLQPIRGKPNNADTSRKLEPLDFAFLPAGTK